MVKVTIEEGNVRISYLDMAEEDPDFKACVRAFRGAALGAGFSKDTIDKFILDPWD